MLAAALAAAAVLASAGGVAPRGGDYVGPALSVHVKHGRVTSIGGPAGNRCALIPLAIDTRIKVRRGHFAYDDVARNVVGGAVGRLRVNATFVSARKLRGTFRYTRGRCTTGKRRFTAKRQAQKRAATPPPIPRAGSRPRGPR
jgi:hypothetical protein